MARHGYRPLPYDFVVAALSLLFAAVSALRPMTGPPFALGGLALPRGYLMAALFLALAALAAALPLLDLDSAPQAARFARTFYPQALVALFFMESILLSQQLGGGRVYDPIFASADQALFGLQPSREFHRALAGRPWLDEFMFASYFLYYILLAVGPWLPWLAGDREEAERQVFVLSAMSALIFSFYLVFRVEGPKYWFEELRALGYAQFSGGPFTAFFQRAFSAATLSGAAFPSSHVAFTAALAILAVRWRRRCLIPWALASALVFTSTVYIYAHYVSDVIGGAAVAALLAPALYRAWPPALAACRRLHGAGA